MNRIDAIHTLWDYMRLGIEPRRADLIIGFGCYNEDVARRAAQLYFEGYAPRILFTGSVGRNTAGVWTESEAVRFASVAKAAGVPEDAILLETRSTNSGENLLFSKRRMDEEGIAVKRVIGVQKPYMERRLAAAFPVYWPEVEVTVTSFPQSYEEYVAGVARWGRTERDTINMIVGDFQRIERYAALGYQIPQVIPGSVWEAFNFLVAAGFTQFLI